MLYRIKVDLSFTDYSDMDDIKDKVLDVFDKAVTINPGTLYQERGYLITHDCHHDESPTASCPVVEKHETPV